MNQRKIPRFALAWICGALLMSAGCQSPPSRPDAGGPPSPLPEEDPTADRAGFFDACTDTVLLTITSPDGLWTASQLCDRTVLDGPDMHLERPSGYPVAFAPDSHALLFVSNGAPVERLDRLGRPYLQAYLPALYVLRLPPSHDDFGTRLMNTDAFRHTATSTLAVPASENSDGSSEWSSEHVFRYVIDLPQHPRFSGTFEVDIDAPRPEVRRAP